MRKTADGLQRLDLRGLRCPLPALKTAGRLKEMRAGAEIVVLADDPLARLDIAHLCREDGHDLVDVAQDEGHLRFRIRRGNREA